MPLVEQRPAARTTIAGPEIADLEIATTRPGTPGGIFMREFWQVLYRSQDLPCGHAKPIRIMSEDYTLYRGQSGRVQRPPRPLRCRNYPVAQNSDAGTTRHSRRTAGKDMENATC